MPKAPPWEALLNFESSMSSFRAMDIVKSSMEVGADVDVRDVAEAWIEDGDPKSEESWRSQLCCCCGDGMH